LEIYSIQTIISDHRSLLEDKLDELEAFLEPYITDVDLRAKINLEFKPSKTAQNALNFMIKGKEDDFLNSDENEILNIWKIIYILLKQKYENMSCFQLAKNMFDNILPKLNVDSLSKIEFNIENLFLNVICQNLQVSNDQHDKITKIVESVPDIFNSASIMKINKCFGYITFVLHEIYEFITRKTTDNVLIVKLKKAKIDLIKMKEKIKLINQNSKFD
jgi:hypothetical protein